MWSITVLRPDAVERERIQLVVRRDRVARVLDPHVTQGARVVVVVRAAELADEAALGDAGVAAAVFAQLQTARPSSHTPPQPPRACSPGASSLVKMIGAEAVPCALIFAPRSITSVPWVARSPKITTPAGIVSVACDLTRTTPRST
jgi:hypothetical protein